MALTHIEPVRTCRVLRTHRELGQPDSLSNLLNEEFGTDHKIMTAELGRIWSLPCPMVAAYQYRAFPKAPCDDRLGLVVAAGVTAVQNAAGTGDQYAELSPWAEALGIAAEDVQSMATIGERQQEKVQSLASNMTR